MRKKEREPGQEGQEQEKGKGVGGNLDDSDYDELDQKALQNGDLEG